MPGVYCSHSSKCSWFNPVREWLTRTLAELVYQPANISATAIQLVNEAIEFMPLASVPLRRNAVGAPCYVVTREVFKSAQPGFKVLPFDHATIDFISLVSSA
jgi:hypothetical protein